MSYELEQCNYRISIDEGEDNKVITGYRFYAEIFGKIIRLAVNLDEDETEWICTHYLTGTALAWDQDWNVAIADALYKLECVEEEWFLEVCSNITALNNRGEAWM